MGNFLNVLRYTPQANPLLKSSLSKLREYHGSFKSVCDTFSIDLTEYEQIFGSNEQIFKIWDTDNNGLIDALELFSGLILFSDASFDEKIRFLFDIFDFNEVNFLTIVDLEFMLISCANATLKIVRQNLEFKDDEMNEFLSNYFSDDSRIDAQQMIKWCSKVPEITRFLAIIEQKSPELKKPYSNLIQTISLIHEANPVKRVSYFQTKSLGDIMNNASYQKKIEWIAEKSKKVFNMNPSEQHLNTKDVSTKINWVYGFCSEGVRKPLEYLKTPGEKAASEKILYFTACIVVIYFPKLYEQKHYLEHDSEILCLTVAKNSSLVATGELATRPAIHIWDSNTLQNLGVIKGIHQDGVHLMKFFKDDEYLATCGIRENSAVLIYNVKDSSLVLSTFIPQFAVELISIDNHSEDFLKNQELQSAAAAANGNTEMDYFNYDNTFILCSANQLILFHYLDGHFITHDINFTLFEIDDPLLCATAVRIPYSKFASVVSEKKNENLILIVTGHEKGRITIWKNFENQHQMIEKYTEDIVSIVNYEFGILVATYQKIHLWDIAMQSELREISFMQPDLHFTLISYDIVQLKAFSRKLLVATKEGDVIQLEFVKQKRMGGEQFQNGGFEYEKRIQKQFRMDDDEKLHHNDDDEEDYEMEDNNNDSNAPILVHPPSFMRNNFISRLKGDFNAMCLLQRADSDEKVLYAAGNQGIVYAFSLESHEIIDMWQLHSPISAIDYIFSEKYGNIFAIGFKDGRILVKFESQNRQEWYPGEEHFQQGKQINDLRFSSDGVLLIAAIVDGCVRVFQMSSVAVAVSAAAAASSIPAVAPPAYAPNGVTPSQPAATNEKKEMIGSFFASEKRDIILVNEEPLSVEFSDDNKSFLIGAASNQYKFELPDLKKKNLAIDSDEQINCTIWNTRYCKKRSENQFEDYHLPIIIGSDIKIFLASGENGYIHFWKDRAQLEQNCGGFLRGHCSRVSRLCMAKTQDYFFSLGSSDNTLIEWKIEFSQEFEQRNGLSNGGGSSSGGGNLSNQDSSNKGMGSNGAGVNGTTGTDMNNYIPQIANLPDENLMREILYCHSNESKYIESLKDSFVLVKGINSKTIPQIYQELIPKYIAASSLMKRPPAVNISLDYLYGFQAFDKRRSLYYVHVYYMGQSQSKKKKDKIGRRNKNETTNQSKSIIIPPQYQKEMLFAKRQLLPYDEVHDNCKRHFVYFSGRVGVVLNPLSNTQKFYEGHQNKITCLAIHPLKFFVATGESAQNPKIHVWNVFNPEPFKILNTYHKNGILHITFSRDRDSNLLISVGVDVHFSIQVMNWKTEEIVGVRNTGSHQIFDVVFNPYNKYEFASCGSKNITLWEMNGRNLLRKKVVNVQEESGNTSMCITCLSYMSYSLGDQIESDIIAGNSFGDLILVACGKYIVAKEGAHSKMVNCLKITELFQGKDLIITCGEDEYVRIWDTKFNLIKDIAIRKTGHFSDTPLQRNLSAQSLDIFCCKYPKKIDNESAINDKDSETVYPIILFGTRNGDIIEAPFTLEYQGTKKQIGGSNKLNYAEQSGSSSESSSASSEENEDEEDEENERAAGNSRGIRKNDHFGQTESFKFSYEIYLRNTASQRFSIKNNNKKMFFSLHPSKNLMAVVGEDMQLIITDFEKNKLVLSQYFDDGIPTVVRFSPDGDMFIVGFANGVLKLYLMFTTQDKSTKEPRPIPILELLQTIKEYKVAVINIKFAPTEDFFVASFEAPYNHNDNNLIDKDQQSFIAVYRMEQMKEQKQNKMKELQGRNDNFGSQQQQQQIKDSKQYVVKEILRNEGMARPESGLLPFAVYFMSVSDDSKSLVAYYQEIEQQSIRVVSAGLGLFCLWDIEKKVIVQIYDPSKSWVDLVFPCVVHCQDIPSFQSILDQDLMKKEGIASAASSDPASIIMTVMNQVEAILMFGSQKGNIHFAKDFALSSDLEHIDYKSQEQEMCSGKSYAAHISYVSQLEFDFGKRFLFSTGNSDECLLKWNLTIERPLSDYDNLDYQPIDERLIKYKDQNALAEILPKDQFDSLIKDVLPLRDQIADAIQHVEEDREKESELVLMNIIGRKAHNRHSNLFYDFDERFIYIAGNNLVIHTVQDLEEPADQRNNNNNQDNNGEDSNEGEEDDDEPFVKQEFIKLDQSANTINPEISCFVLSSDKKLLCAGTCQMQAKIIIWDICSQTCLKQLQLMNTNYILHIKMAYDNRHLVCVALSNDYSAIIYLIDSRESRILGSAKLMHSVPYKIKDIEFFPNSIYRFITCGIQHIAVWTLQGNILSYSNLQIKASINLDDDSSGQSANTNKKQSNSNNNKKISSNNNNPSNNIEDVEQDQNNIDEANHQFQVTFVSLIFINETIITAGNDGFLYVWNDMKIVKTQNAHPMLCLNTTKDSNMFASGGMDGKVIIWELGSSEYDFMVEKVYEYQLNPEGALENSPYCYQIQSVCIGSKYILAGTKSGDIYELIRPNESEIKNPTSSKNKHSLRFACHDNEIVKSIQFNGTSDKLYTITENGLFCVWNLRKITKIYTKRFNLKIHSIILLKRYQIIIIASERQIQFFNLNDYKERGNPITYDNKIADVKLSFNEEMLAVALDPNQKTNAKIIIYKYVQSETEVFTTFIPVPIQSTSLEFIDFSTDNFFLLYKDNVDDVEIIDFRNKDFKKVIKGEVEFNMEWCTDGIKVSSNMKGVLHTYYSDENKILKVQRIGDRQIAVTDEMGSIRVFSYPCQSQSQGYFKCYTDHLNYINQCVLSPDKRYLVTCSQSDRCILIWRVKYDIQEQGEGDFYEDNQSNSQNISHQNEDRY